jgi:hypothetical protein
MICGILTRVFGTRHHDREETEMSGQGYGSGDWTIYFLRQLRPIGGQNETNGLVLAALDFSFSLS